MYDMRREGGRRKEDGMRYSKRERNQRGLGKIARALSRALSRFLRILLLAAKKNIGPLSPRFLRVLLT